MKSYHDAEQTAYDSVRAEPLNRIHGKPSWRAKEELKNLAARQAIRFKVSYKWSGGKGLLALIIGAARLALDYPALDAYVQPDQPDNDPNTGLGARPSADDIRDAKTANETLKQDWAVIEGFRRGMGENICDALDAKYYKYLNHHVYGYDDVWPEDFFDEVNIHVPLGEPAIKECREEYFREWELSRKTRPETIRKFKKRLDEKQRSLLCDNIKFTDTEKANHYLLQIYRSGRFPTTTIRAWKQKTLQSYADASYYLEKEDGGLKEIERLTSNSSYAHGYGNIDSAMEENLEAILEKINTSVEERVNAAIETGIARITQQYRQVDQANTTATADLKAQVANLKSTVAQLRSQLGALFSDINSGNRDGSKTDTHITQSREYRHKGPQEERITWKTGLLWDNS